MSTEPTAAALLDLVVAIPGVSGIEPGVGTTLRTLDSRIRGADTGANHFGVRVDRADATVTVEVCLDLSRPVRESVRAIQLALREALAGTMPAGTQWRVRVQSLETG